MEHHPHDVLVQYLLARETEAAGEIKHSVVVTQDLADNLAGAARVTVAHHLLHQLPAEPLPLDVRAPATASSSNRKSSKSTTNVFLQGR
jgi:hypothetical protein